MVEIVHFDEKYAQSFYTLNVEWLKTFFFVEPFDEEVLNNPEFHIIEKGGHIFFARIDEVIVGTVALMPTKDPKVYELTKMAVSPKHRGFKIGQQLIRYCIEFANSNNHTGLILYSNTQLENAIYIYRKYGFVDIPIEKNSPYIRSDIKMVLDFKSDL